MNIEQALEIAKNQADFIRHDVCQAAEVLAGEAGRLREEIVKSEVLRAESLAMQLSQSNEIAELREWKARVEGQEPCLFEYKLFPCSGYTVFTRSEQEAMRCGSDYGGYRKLYRLPRDQAVRIAELESVIREVIPVLDDMEFERELQDCINKLDAAIAAKGSDETN